MEEWVERPIIRGKGGEFWSLADEWFDIDPNPTHSPAPLTTESTGGQQPVERWPSSAEKQKEVHTDDPVQQGKTRVCTLLSFQTPSVPALPP